MTDTFHDRLNRIEAALQGDPVAAALAKLDERLGGGSHLPAPAAPKAAPAAAAEEPTMTRRDAILAKLETFDPFEADPEPTMMAFLSHGEGMLIREIREAMAESTTLDERLELRRAWEEAKAKARPQHEATVDAHFERQVEEARQARETRAELEEMARRERETDLRSLGERARNLAGGGVFAEAAATGALSMADGSLAEAGWSRASLAKLAEVRSRMVEVDPNGPIEGQGFQLAEADGRVYAYVPHEDVAGFADRFGVDREPEPEAVSGAGWRFDGGEGYE